MQICVPPNIDLIGGPFFHVGYCQSPTIPTIHNCFRKKSVHLGLPHLFTFNTAVVKAVWAGQNFKWSKFDFS